MVLAQAIGNRIITESSDRAAALCSESCFGFPLPESRVELSWLEAVYLLEKGKLALLDGRGKRLDLQAAFAKAARAERGFGIRYAVFRDIRNRGYIVKTGLKFGAEFRVYPKGVKPGQGHARWLVFPIGETEPLKLPELAARARVAHSTKKTILLAVVSEQDIVYWELRWIRP